MDLYRPHVGSSPFRSLPDLVPRGRDPDVGLPHSSRSYRQVPTGALSFGSCSTYPYARSVRQRIHAAQAEINGVPMVVINIEV